MTMPRALAVLLVLLGISLCAQQPKGEKGTVTGTTTIQELKWTQSTTQPQTLIVTVREQDLPKPTPNGGPLSLFGGGLSHSYTFNLIPKAVHLKAGMPDDVPICVEPEAGKDEVCLTAGVVRRLVLATPDHIMPAPMPLQMPSQVGNPCLLGGVYFVECPK